MKKIISILLIIAMILALGACGGSDSSSSSISSAPKPAQTPKAEFDDDNVMFRIAVMSDVHISYNYHTEEQIINNADRYADAVAYMYYLSDGKLDAIMMCGDYTAIGDINQGTTFAQCTSVIFNDIFKENKPKIMIGMGNHDTCWGGCMTDKQWYELLAQYGLCDGIESDSDYEYGNLHIKLTNGEETYHMLYIETLSYAENVFHAKTLYWVDSMLSKITRENPDHHVIIGSHAPIKESGVYGTDLKLDGGATWATAKDNIHNILKKYPQVVYFSGHNHYAGYLNTTIMQKDYTALNVAATLSMGYYNSQYNKYLDSSGTGRNGGMGYYIEIDKNGAMKLQRVDFSYSGDAAKVEKLSSGQVPNPLYGKNDTQETISVASIKSCTLTGNKDIKIHGEDWIIPAPDTAKKHLTYYSEKRGKVTAPTFKEGAKVDAYRSAGSTMTFSFPAATSPEGVFILFYAVTVYDGNGTAVASTKIIGNYCDSTKGVVDGTSHLDATLFSYEMSGIPSGRNYSVGIYAVDEYGNVGGSIYSNQFDF